MSKPKPQKYKTTNWKDYSQALRTRGSLTVWLDTQMQREAAYSDAAVQCCLTMKVLFGLALRSANLGLRAGHHWIDLKSGLVQFSQHLTTA